MSEGWCGRDHLILFNEAEIASASNRSAMSQIPSRLPRDSGCAGGMISFCKTPMGPPRSLVGSKAMVGLKFLVQAYERRCENRPQGVVGGGGLRRAYHLCMFLLVLFLFW